MSPDDLKAAFAPYAASARTFWAGTREPLSDLVAPDAAIRLCHPFGDLTGPSGLWSQALEPLLRAMPDLERREMIQIGGTTPEGQHWLGTCGTYMGTWRAPFLGIPPTGHLAHMRYHEFYRMEDDRVVEMQAIWDLPELMMQSGCWPMSPQLGRFIATPAPMTQDGLTATGDGQAAIDHTLAMLEALCRHPGDPDPTVMELDRFWHKRFNWYGPCGIGTARGIGGFRHWHQIPFLRAMPDRGLDPEGLHSHWIGQGNYAAETGWPNMALTITGDGWLGIAPSAQKITLRSLDFWRMEDGLLRENWVLVDLLDMYAQIGVDVLARMAELTRVRSTGPAPTLGLGA